MLGSQAWVSPLPETLSTLSERLFALSRHVHSLSRVLVALSSGVDSYVEPGATISATAAIVPEALSTSPFPVVTLFGEGRPPLERGVPWLGRGRPVFVTHCAILTMVTTLLRMLFTRTEMRPRGSVGLAAAIR